jgi:hypothetical protein
VESIQAPWAAEERIGEHIEKERKREEMYASEAAQHKVDRCSMTNNLKYSAWVSK